MDCFNMILEVLVNNIVLVATFVRALEGAGIGVGFSVIPESGGPVESLSTAWPYTCQ